MVYGTRKRLKVTQAVRAGITLGTRMLQGGQPLSCLLIENHLYWQPAHSSLRQFRQTIDKAVDVSALLLGNDEPVSWSRIGDRIKSQLPSGSRLILLSDFLHPGDADIKTLKQLNHQYDLTVIQVVDPSELALPEIPLISLHYKNCNPLSLDDTAINRQCNRVLEAGVVQSVNLFKKMGCQFLQLRCDEALDELRDVL